MLEPDLSHEDGDEDFDRVMAITDELADVLDDYDADTGEALSAIGFVVGGVLTFEVVSREAAMSLLDDLVTQIRQGISIAEQNGSAWWVKNKAN